MSYFILAILHKFIPICILLTVGWRSLLPVNLKNIVIISLFAVLTASCIYIVTVVNIQAHFVLNIIYLFTLLLMLINIYWQRSILQYCNYFLIISLTTYNCLLNPNILALTEIEVVNTDFILNMVAVITGIILTITIAVWLNKIFNSYPVISQNYYFIYCINILVWLLLVLPLSAELLLNALKLGLLDAKGNIITYIAKIVAANFVYDYASIVILALILVYFYLQVFFITKKRYQQQQDLIEKRLAKAQFIKVKRTIMAGLFCISLVFFTQLYYDLVFSKPLEPSPAIPMTLDQNAEIRIPIEQVKDGKLYRFSWVASDGKVVRFFIINRYADKISFGVVFDACLLCGDEGYIMIGNQVICIPCKVSIYIPSIGKAGGCNPVPIENWKQDATDIIISQADLEKGLNLFSTIKTIEVIDPVSKHKLFNTDAKYNYTYQNKTYFFENETNYNMFYNDPEKFIQP